LTDDNRYFILVKNLTRHWNEFLSDKLIRIAWSEPSLQRIKLRIPKELYSWIIILQEVFETVYIISMGMNTRFKVDSHLFNA
jgi:hypothetical protein